MSLIRLPVVAERGLGTGKTVAIRKKETVVHMPVSRKPIVAVMCKKERLETIVGISSPFVLNVIVSLEKNIM